MDRVFAWAQGATDVQDCVCHDCPSDGPAGAYSIKIVPTLSDNYSYLVVNASTREAVVVDAADAVGWSPDRPPHSLEPREKGALISFEQRGGGLAPAPLARCGMSGCVGNGDE